MTLDKIKRYAKGIVALLGALATLVVQVLPSLPQDWQDRLAVALPFATFITVYLVPNAAKVLGPDEESEQP